MTFSKDAQLPIKRFGTAANPKLTDGVLSVEMTYPPLHKARGGGRGVKYIENKFVQTTIGGHRRKQSESLVRRVEIAWIEPSNFVPVTIWEMLRGGGDRTRVVTYTHHRPILSQLGDGIEADVPAGIIPLTGFVEDFDPDWEGTDFQGTQVHLCRMVFQESDESES